MPEDWNTYRTRFLVRAKQLTQPFEFTDALGREHHGAPGDYLVQSSEGLLRIAPREIFEDVYVPLGQLDASSRSASEPSRTRRFAQPGFGSATPKQGPNPSGIGVY